MAEAGIVGTLKRLCDWSGHAPTGTYYEHDLLSSDTSIGGLVNPGSEVLSVLSGRGSNRSNSMNAGVVYGSWTDRNVRLPSGRHGHGSDIADGHGGASGHCIPSHFSSMDDDRDVVLSARNALGWLEHGEMYTPQ